MQTQFNAVLAAVRTKRAKVDKEGIETEPPAIVLSIEVPITTFRDNSLGALMRVVDRDVRVQIADDQASFEVAENGRELVTSDR